MNHRDNRPRRHPTSRLASVVVCLLAAALGACAGPDALAASRPDPAMAPPAESAASAATRSLLLISLDGLTPAFLGKGQSPNIDRLAAEGVQAAWMRPSYPSLTFPNHYTIVTGLRPDHHGIVHNVMQDDELGRFTLSDRASVGESRWWGGEPVWVGAEKAGLRTATLSWPGSEAEVAGVRPREWHLFDDKRPIAERLDIVTGWLTKPVHSRPHLVTLYFEHTDTTGHYYGPWSRERLQALETVDAAIGELLARLQRAGVRDTVDIVLVSDHGMTEVHDGHVVATQDMVDPTIATLVMQGQVIGFAPLPGREVEAEAALLGRHAHYSCWRKSELPERWHYGSHPRVPPIVCQMDKGWDAMPRDWIARRPPGTRGSHGFEPDEPEMRAVFIANGPSFAQGKVLPGFDNVDVYPLLARLLGIPAAPHDGNADTLLPALRGQVDAPAQ